TAVRGGAAAGSGGEHVNDTTESPGSGSDAVGEYVTDAPAALVASAVMSGATMTGRLSTTIGHMNAVGVAAFGGVGVSRALHALVNGERETGCDEPGAGEHVAVKSLLTASWAVGGV